MAGDANKVVIWLKGGTKVTVETENTVDVEETKLKTPKPKVIKKPKDMTVEIVLKAFLVNYENSSLVQLLCDVVKDIYILPIYDVVVFDDKTLPRLEYFRFVLRTEKGREISFGVSDSTREPFFISMNELK